MILVAKMILAASIANEGLHGVNYAYTPRVPVKQHDCWCLVYVPYGQHDCWYWCMSPMDSMIVGTGVCPLWTA